jgi:Fur family transcriptional regulator, peroxide stress response regulator
MDLSGSPFALRPMSTSAPGTNTSQKEAIVQTLKEKGLRVTPQRFAVYANLLQRTDHPTVDQLLHDLNQDLPVSSQATIYSTLEALQGVGLVREVLLEPGVTRYDANVESHHHFCCRQCGAIEDIPWQAFHNLDLQQLRQGLQADRYEVTVSGVCDRCH